MWESFNNQLEKWARERPEKPAVIQSARRISYRTLYGDAAVLAGAWAASRVEPGDRIVSYCGNTLEAVVTMAACRRLGAVFVPLNPSIKPSKLARILDELEPAMLVAAIGKVPDLRRVACGLARMPAVHVTDIQSTGDLPPDLREDTETDVEVDAFWRPCTEHSAERYLDTQLPSGEPAAVLYAADSDGKPRGVMLSHENLAFVSGTAAERLGGTGDDVIVSALPISQGYGLQQAVTTLRLGATLVLEPSFAYPAAVLQTIERTKATGFPVVPSMAGILLRVDVERFDLSSVRCVVNVGGPLAEEHVQRLREVFPQAKLWSVYGRTECLYTACSPLEHAGSAPARVGQPVRGTEARILDDAGHEAEPEVAGELAVRGPHVMLGYWQRPDSSGGLRVNPTDERREFRCGDLFRTDLDGNLYHVGRGDDTIDIGGEYVAPREVETVLRAHPCVMDAVVYADEDELFRDRRICAVVRLRRNEQVSQRELQMFCAEHLEDFMVPSVIRVRHHALPHSRLQKRSERTSTSSGRSQIR